MMNLKPYIFNILIFSFFFSFSLKPIESRELHKEGMVKKIRKVKILFNKKRALAVEYNTFNEVTLGDVADIAGLDKLLVEKITDIKIIKRLPSDLKRQVIINKRRIIACLKQKKINLESVDLVLPENIVVSRKFTTIGSKKVKSTIEDYLYNSLLLDRKDYTVKNIKFNKVNIPLGEMSLKIINKGNGKFRLGRNTFNVLVSVNNNFKKKFYVKAFIEEFKEIILSSKRLKRGVTLTEEDLIIKRVKIISSTNNYFMNPDDIIGKISTRNIEPNEILKDKDIKEVYMLESGDRVRIKAESSFLKVVAPGIVKEKGKKGDFIKVLNISSRKFITAEVVDSNSVLVRF